ncbi:MAG: CheR family methyltransferase, partial [Pseudomonadota bacterium]
RMVALGINDYDEYVEFCRNSDVEVEELHRDLLISVTRFFRDPNHFEQLRKSLESAISKRESRQFRVWVAGCATGEEAYSIAILIAEAMGGVDELTKRNVQIFASDIDDRALEIGRRAIYPGSAAADIPKAYLDRYFDLSGANIQVRQELRNVVLFSHHNVAQDPPFINVDLISLRNVLIYFNTGLQERVLRRVHYALAPKGMLFLGTSEAFGSMRSYFEMISHTDKLYRKREVRTSPIMNFADPKAAFSARAVGSGTALQKRESPTPDMQLFESLARSVAPNGFIVTRAGEIVRVLGDISNVIELSEKSALDLSTRILGPGMRDEANSMINVTLKTGEARTGRWHSLKGAKAQRVRLRAYPILNAFGGEDNVLFSLEYGTEPKEPRSLDQLNEEDRTKYVRQIEQEMQTTRETLQQTVEELQTSNEELQSVNEELQSTNEELQATNEELETSNEELQSTNEELITVNEEMQVNSSELQRLTIELSGVVKSSPYTVLVMDQALLIRRVSDRAKVFFNLGDLPPTGLHLAQISATEGFQALPALCSDALRERSPKSLYVETGGRSYSILAGPFSGAHDSVVGLKLTIIEVDVSAYATMASVMEELGGVGHWR